MQRKQQQTIRLRDNDGKTHTLSIGDCVEFKYDVEQSGPIVAIGHGSIDVEAREGGYVHGGGCDEETCEGCSSIVTLQAGRFWMWSR